MNRWKMVGYYREGVVYARGDERKVVIPDHPVFYLKLDSEEVWWRRNTSRNKTTALHKDK